MKLSFPLQGLLPALLVACTSTPVAPIPPPLPETVAWATGGSGTVGGAYLGLKTRENVGRSFEELDSSTGVRVSRVVENSPAAEAGFRIGDVVLAYAEHDTDDPETLDALVAGAEPDSVVELTVQRGDTVFTVPVKLAGGAEEPVADPEVSHRLDPSRSRAGWLTGRGGVVLVTSDLQGPFARAGIRPGSVVRTIDGEELFSDRALIRKLQSRPPGTRVEVGFEDPDGESRTKTVQLLDQERRVTRASVPVLFTYTSDPQGEEKSFVLLDLWIISLFRYERTGEEKHYRFLRFFQFSTGVGELTQ